MEIKIENDKTYSFLLQKLQYIDDWEENIEYYRK